MSEFMAGLVTRKGELWAQCIVPPAVDGLREMRRAVRYRPRHHFAVQESYGAEGLHPREAPAYYPT